MTNAEAIIDSNTHIRNAFSIRAVLSNIDFFKEDIFKNIVDSILVYPKLSSYVSSYYIDNKNKEIQISMRKTYFNRFNENRFNSLLMYTMIDKCVKDVLSPYKNELNDLIGSEWTNKVYAETSTIYDVFRTDENTIIIKFY